MWHHCYSISRSLRKNWPICSLLVCGANTARSCSAICLLCSLRASCKRAPQLAFRGEKRSVQIPTFERDRSRCPTLRPGRGCPYSARNIRPSLWDPKDECSGPCSAGWHCCPPGLLHLKPFLPQMSEEEAFQTAEQDLLLPFKSQLLPHCKLKERATRAYCP